MRNQNPAYRLQQSAKDRAANMARLLPYLKIRAKQPAVKP